MKNAVFILTLVLFGINSIHANDFQNVDSKVFSQMIQKGEGVVLDVRTPQEYSRGHIEGSTLISINDRTAVEKVNLLQKDKPVYVYCLTGSRSRSVASYLSKNGFAKVYNLQRGIMEWQQFGYSVVQSAAPVASSAKAFSTTEFNSLLQSNALVLVDFHAPWCAPCKKMAPIVDEIQSEYKSKVKVEKVDVEANKSLQTTYEVQSIPGLLLFKNGKQVWKHTGLISYEDLAKVIEGYVVK